MSLIDRILDGLGLGADDFDPPDPAAEQAVIDLLTLAMLVDRTSSESERERIRDHLARQDWPDGANPFGYADAAMARVRHALGDDTLLDELLVSVADRLRCDDDRRFALSLVRELAGLDGTIDDREADLLARLRARFERDGP
jgi:uncharacterized tellurite resistance protein B-like protein